MQRYMFDLKRIPPSVIHTTHTILFLPLFSFRKDRSYFCFQEIEPIKLEWTESSKCFYSDEFKLPTGKYVGNLVIDGVFYPVEDIVVKHYTFEVDLYLKDGEYNKALSWPK